MGFLSMGLATVPIYKLPKGDNLKDWVDCETEAERVGFERAFNES